MAGREGVSRRRFLELAGAAGAAGAGALVGAGCLPKIAGQGEVRAAPRKPNVLFIAVDDLRTQLGCYGHRETRSPNIDALAASGVTFEHAYCQEAICAASRSSLLSGCRPDTTGIYGLQTPLRKAMPDVVSLPEQFKRNGYESVSLGKIYHHHSDDYPRGWSSKPWHAKGNWKGRGYHSPESHAQFAKVKKRTGMTLMGPSVECGDVADGDYPDGMTCAKAIEEMRRLKDKPFFLAAGFMKPHLPFNAPRRYWDLYDRSRLALPDPSQPKGAPDIAFTSWGELRAYTDIPAKGDLDEAKTRELIHGYYACVSYVDALVGRLTAELERLGLRENTVVILWGDHGWKLGEYGDWCKHTNFELDAHVPMLLAAPGARRGARTKALVEFVDIYPTLSELAGLDLPGHIEGTSMVPLLSDPGRAWKRAAFSQYPRGRTMGYSMRTDRWRYTEWRNKRTKDVTARELYDHSAHEIDRVNVADRPANAALVKELHAMMDAGWRAARPEA